jgi:hypothetical protein
VSHATNGRAREHRFVKYAIRHGWTQEMRAAGSKGAADHGAALVQVGGKSKALGPDDRTRLVAAATRCGALALLAVYTPRLTVWQVTEDVPSKWERWSM